MIKTVLISSDDRRRHANMVWIMYPPSLDSSSKPITNCAELQDLVYAGFNYWDKEDKRSEGCNGFLLFDYDYLNDSLHFYSQP